jgi:TrmH family RNA methyltransferase
MPVDLARIASRSNAQFRALRTLAGSAAQRRRSRRTLLDGAHLVAACLAHAPPVLIAVSESARERAEIRQLLARARDVPQVCFADALFAQLAPVQTPTGILAVIDIPDTPAAKPSGSLLVLLDAVQDPGNVGAIIRSAAAAGADAVLLSHQCADPWSPRTLRAAMGAHFALAIHCHCDLEAAVRGFDGRVIATAGRGGVAPHALPLTGPVALVFGAEGTGVSAPLAKAAHAAVSIPLARGIESVNVGAAAAVILFERVRQLAQAASVRRR